MVILLGTNRHTQRRKHILNLLVVPHLVLQSLLDVQNLTTQGHNCLEVTVAALFCGTTRRISLDEENLGFLAVAGRAVGQFTRQTCTRQHGFALHKLACVARSVTSSSRQHNLLHDSLCILGVLLQVLGQGLRHSGINRCDNLAVTQFGLGLTLELRFANLNRHNCGKTLAEVVTTNLNFHLREHTRLVGVLFEGTGQRTAETSEVSTTLDSINVVHIRVYILRVAVVVLHRNLNGSTVALGLDVDNILDDGVTTGCIQIFDKLFQTIVREEGLALLVAILVNLARIHQSQVDTLVQVSQLAQTCRQSAVVVNGLGEDFAVGFEGHGSTCAVGIAHNLNFGLGHASAVTLTVNLATTVYLGNQQGRKCVHTRHTHTVQTTRHFVATLIEFTTRVQHGQYNLESRFTLLLVEVGRDTTTVVRHADRVILIDGYNDVVAETCQRLVNRVVHHLINQVVKSAYTDVTDVHRRTFSYCFKSFKHLNTRRRVFLLMLFNFFAHLCVLFYLVFILIFVSSLQGLPQCQSLRLGHPRSAPCARETDRYLRCCGYSSRWRNHPQQFRGTDS